MLVAPDCTVAPDFIDFVILFKSRTVCGFRWQDACKSNLEMSLRIRHCVECPKCHICYLIGFSPYRNAAYLERSDHGSGEEYTLHCFCHGAQAPRCWRWLQAKPCEVSREAHERGYGTSDEIWPTDRTQLERWFDVTKYLNLRQS